MSDQRANQTDCYLERGSGDRPDDWSATSDTDRHSKVTSRYAVVGFVAVAALIALLISAQFIGQTNGSLEEVATPKDGDAFIEIDSAHLQSGYDKGDKKDTNKNKKRHKRSFDRGRAQAGAEATAPSETTPTSETTPSETTTATESTPSASFAPAAAIAGPENDVVTPPHIDRFVGPATTVKTPALDPPASSNRTADDRTGTSAAQATSGSNDRVASPSTTTSPAESTTIGASPIVSETQPAFVANFDDNTGLDQFRIGVYHRNLGSQELGQPAEIWGDGNAFHGGAWSADHDTNCGPPSTSRTLESRKIVESGKPVRADFSVNEIAYLCKDHLMTSMGDVDGYSIVWFSPQAQFNRSQVKTVSWEVNVTDLKARQWWEVSIIPVGTEFLATEASLANTANINTYHPDAVVISNGPFAGDVGITVNGENQYDDWRKVCGSAGLDPEGCADKKIRRTFSVTDSGDGTLTIDYGGLHSQTVQGQFPESFEVFFKDHNYTPDKDGEPIGHTWHWDNIGIY